MPVLSKVLALSGLNAHLLLYITMQAVRERQTSYSAAEVSKAPRWGTRRGLLEESLQAGIVNGQTRPQNSVRTKGKPGKEIIGKFRYTQKPRKGKNIQR